MGEKGVSYRDSIGIGVLTEIEIEVQTNLAELRADDCYLDESRYQFLQNWLAEHPQETIQAIRTLKLTKYDVAVAKLVARIGPPDANPCASQMIELIYDMNWPVFQTALSALSKLDGAAIANAIEKLVIDEEFRKLDKFYWVAKQLKPDWLGLLLPQLDEAMEKIAAYATDSSILELQNILKTGSI